jgi:hypothetical protein
MVDVDVSYTRVLGEPELWAPCEQACDIAVRRGLKPVRRPTVHESELAEFTSETRRRFGSALVLTTAPHAARPHQTDVIYGYSEDEVREFVTLTTQATSPNPLADLDPIKRRIGALLGYPPCCVEAFIEAASDEEDLTERTLLARRFGAGVLDPRWPLLLLVYEHYLPCSLHCEQSLARADALAAALADDGVHAPAGGWGRIVFLAELEHPGNVAVLLRDAGDDRGFGYRLIALNHSADRLAPVGAGDRLVFEGSAVTVLRGGERLHVYAGNVGVFDVEREWGDTRWSTRVEAATPHEPAPEPEPEPEPRDVVELSSIAEQPATAEQVRAELERLLGSELQLVRCETGEHGWIRASLDGDAGRFVVTVVPRPLAREGGFVAGVAARFDPSGQLAVQRALVAALAEHFDARACTPASEVHALVLETGQPSTGEFALFAGFAACWPICDADGITRLALVAHGRALELIVAPRAGRVGWPGLTRRCAVGYPSETELRTPQERAAFARFVQRLRTVEDHPPAG